MRNQTLQLPPKFFTTWSALSVLDEAAIVLKQEPPLPRYVTEISTATGEYEKRLRTLWEAFKENPTRDAAKRLAEQMKAASAEYWPEAVASVLGVGTEDLIPKQRRMVKDALDEHHNFIDKSLLPDILRVFDRGGVFEADDFNIFDHRMIFMYAGALWSLGFLATITYDGLNVRDLADVFVMLGPDDERTCTGPRGCHKFVNKFFTVAQIITDDIIPGHFACLTNCRHIMLPVASPLTKREKHQPGKHPQKLHAGSRGAAGIADLVERTAAINEERGVEDQDIYVDKDAKSVSSAKSPEALRQELGGPIRVNEAFGKPPISAHRIDRSLFDHLEGKAKSGEGLQEVLDREIRTAAITRVPLDKVNLVQKYVFEKPLQKAVESKSYKKSDDLYLLKIKGQFFVHNGNHRVGAAKLNNEDTLNFKVIPVDLTTQKEHTPILALDFDGTLSDYKGGWQGIDVINANPSPGAQEFVKQALTKFDVHVFSSRSKDPAGIKAMQAWTREHNFPVGMKFVTVKPAAHVTLDDRAITFEGKWPSVQSLVGFQSWVSKVLKHLQGRHPQKLHGRRGGALALRLEDITVTVQGDKHGVPDGQYHSVYSTNQRKAALNKVKKLSAGGGDFRAVRANGRYHVVDYSKSPKDPIKLPPKPTKKAVPLEERFLPKKLAEQESARSLLDKIPVNTTSPERDGPMVNEVMGKIPKWHLNTGEKAFHQRVAAINIPQRSNVTKEYKQHGGQKDISANGFAVTSGLDSGQVYVGGRIKKSFYYGGVKQTLAHEISHQVFERRLFGATATATRNTNRITKTKDKMDTLFRQRDEKFGKGGWGSTAITGYATTNTNEFRAETYGYMVMDPTRLKRNDPEAYGIMLEMFK